jgi:hypothetical protein
MSAAATGRHRAKRRQQPGDRAEQTQERQSAQQDWNDLLPVRESALPIRVVAAEQQIEHQNVAIQCQTQNRPDDRVVRMSRERKLPGHAGRPPGGS